MGYGFIQKWYFAINNFTIFNNRIKRLKWIWVKRWGTGRVGEATEPQRVRTFKSPRERTRFLEAFIFQPTMDSSMVLKNSNRLCSIY
jgi:hypothetical protein